MNGTSAFPLLQDPTTQCTGAFEDKMTSLFESLHHFVGGAIPLSFLIVGIATPLFFRSWTQKRPMSLQEFHGVIPDFFGIRNKILIILFPLSLNIDLKMIRSLKSSGLMFFVSKSFWISRRRGNDENPGKFSTRISSVLRQVLLIS